MMPWFFQYVVPEGVPLIGGQDLSLPSFFFFLTVGYMLATGIVVREAERSHQPVRESLDRSLTWLLVGLVGARLGYVLTHTPSYYVAHPGALLDLWQGSLTFFTGLLLVAVVGYLLARRRHTSFWLWADMYTAPLAFAMIFGHVGCLSAGALHGKPIDFGGVEWPWGITSYGGQVPGPLLGVVLHPAAIYLALVDVALFLWVTHLRGKSLVEGQVFLRWLLAFAVGRVLVGLVIFTPGGALLDVGGMMAAGAAVVAAILLFRRPAVR